MIIVEEGRLFLLGFVIVFSVSHHSLVFCSALSLLLIKARLADLTRFLTSALSFFQVLTLMFL